MSLRGKIRFAVFKTITARYYKKYSETLRFVFSSCKFLKFIFLKIFNEIVSAFFGSWK